MLAELVAAVALLTGHVVAVVPTFVSREPASLPMRLEKVRELLKEVPLIDGHNDLASHILETLDGRLSRFPFDKDLSLFEPWNADENYHTDLALLRRGLVGGQFWSAFRSCNSSHNQVLGGIEQVDLIHRFIKKYPKFLEFVDSSDGIQDAFTRGHIASLIGLEGGQMIELSLAALRMFYTLGVRYMTLTHLCSTPWAESSTEEVEKITDVSGLTGFGEAVIAEMNRLGMIVDISHVAMETMEDVLNLSSSPIMFSHSNARALCNHTRNVPDEILRKLPQNGGIVMVTFLPKYLTYSEEATIHDVIEHINYIRNISGVDHVGIGSDFDGIDKVPEGLENVGQFPNLFAELMLDPTWTDEDLKKLAGLNLIRVFKGVEMVRDALRNELPIERSIGDSDFLADSLKNF